MSAVITQPSAAPPRTPAQRAHRRSALFIRWLRRIHLWIGLWGAVLGFLFGATGILMNHRAVLKIPVDKAVQRSARVALPDTSSARFRDPRELAQWLQAELQLNGPPTRVHAEPPKRVIWADREVEQPARWVVSWHAPQRGVSAEYHVGNRFVKVDTIDATPLGTLMRMHMATGAGVFWVLLSDTVAGGTMLLSVTGLLLWTRLHRVKLAAVVGALGALLGGVWALWGTG